ncbi:MAG: HAD family phosphatase [Planctomycetes bacterium]|nr:HAD family phosphatase [Planctomycetota bacterium]
MREIAGVLCDLDGTLVDSEDLHYDAWKILMARYGVEAPAGWNDRFIGLPDSDAVVGLKEEYPSLAGNDGLLEEKQEIFRGLLRQRGVALVYPGVRERLEKLHAEGVKLAVGTNSILVNTELALEAGGIRHLFSYISTLDMHERGKPDPDVYLGAAAGIDVPPEKCVVIEDSTAGIASGRAAGCTVLAVTTTYPPGQADKLAAADQVFPATKDAMDWILRKGTE